MHSSTAPLLLLLLCVGGWRICAADEVEYNSCGSDVDCEGTVVAVTVDPYERDSTGKCLLYRENNITIGIRFTSSVASDTLKHQVYGVFWGVKAAYTSLGTNDACPKLQGEETCPLTADTTYSYTATFHVSRYYPAIPLDVQWSLLTENDVCQICVRIPVKISPPKRT